MSVVLSEHQRMFLLDELSKRLSVEGAIRPIALSIGIAYPVLLDIKNKKRTRFYTATLVKVAAYYGIMVQ